jgi:hypothetical protein
VSQHRATAKVDAQVQTDVDKVQAVSCNAEQVGHRIVPVALSKRNELAGEKRRDRKRYIRILMRGTESHDNGPFADLRICRVVMLVKFHFPKINSGRAGRRSIPKLQTMWRENSGLRTVSCRRREINSLAVVQIQEMALDESSRKCIATPENGSPQFISSKDVGI